jgi:hypothetical protein
MAFPQFRSEMSKSLRFEVISDGSFKFILCPNNQWDHVLFQVARQGLRHISNYTIESLGGRLLYFQVLRIEEVFHQSAERT